MARLTHTLADDAIATLGRRVRQEGDLTHAADEVRGGAQYHDNDESSWSATGRDGSWARRHGIPRCSTPSDRRGGGRRGGRDNHASNGAYHVQPHSYKITFLDTRAHHAFTAWRPRREGHRHLVGFVVAADDGVMPHTSGDRPREGGGRARHGGGEQDRQGGGPTPNRVRGEWRSRD